MASFFPWGAERRVQDAFLGPSVGASADGVPIASLLRWSTPFAAMACDVPDGVENLRVRQRYIAAQGENTDEALSSSCTRNLPK